MDLFTTLLSQLVQTNTSTPTKRSQRSNSQRRKSPKKLCLRCPPDLGRYVDGRSVKGLCYSCATVFCRYKKDFRGKHSDEPDPTVAQFIERCPARNKKPCLRCPSKLARSGVSGLCRCCYSYFMICRKNHSEGRPELPVLTIPEFVEKHPRKYIRGNEPCLRCPSGLNRKSCGSGLCRFCMMSFRRKRKDLKKKNSDVPELTVMEFIEKYPSRYARKN